MIFFKENSQKMSYLYTIPSSKVTKQSLVKALRYANIENSDNQMCLLEIDQYKLAIYCPENIDPLNGQGKLENIIHPDTNSSVKVYMFTKSNSTLVRNVIKLFNDNTWIKECQFTFELKNDPLKIAEVTHLVDSGNVNLNLYEYSEKFLVIFGAPKELSIIPTGMPYNGYFIGGSKYYGYGIAKSNKKIITELKKLFNCDFETLYTYSSSSIPAFNPTLTTPSIPSSIPRGTNVQAPILPQKERTIKEDLLSLFSKINSSEFEKKEIMSNTLIIYGARDKVETELLENYDGADILMEISTKDKSLKYIKLESI